MSEDGKNDDTFTVQDRRTASGGGKEKAASAEGSETPGPEAPEPSASKREETGPAAEKGPGPIPKVDFSTFVFSLFSSALIQLGDMADPVTGEKPAERNLDAVSQTIDLLDLLREKTEGNLTEDEANLIRESTSQLKFKYIDAVKGKG